MNAYDCPTRTPRTRKLPMRTTVSMGTRQGVAEFRSQRYITFCQTVICERQIRHG